MTSVDDALVLIKPRPEQEASCATTIRARVELLRKVHHDLEAIPSPGDLKKELKDIGRDLERTRAASRTYSAISKATIFEKDEAKQKAFLGDLDWLIVSAQFYHDALVVRPGSRRWDNVKVIAAKYADELLRSFSASAPGKTVGGTFYALAALLYKEATGKKANLEQYCRELDRIEPNIVVKMPFAGR
jgi:hypothetical protein